MNTNLTIAQVIADLWMQLTIAQNEKQRAENELAELLANKDWDKYRDEAGNPRFDGYVKRQRPAEPFDIREDETGRIGAHYDFHEEHQVAEMAEKQSRGLDPMESESQKPWLPWSDEIQRKIDERIKKLIEEHDQELADAAWEARMGEDL